NLLTEASINSQQPVFSFIPTLPPELDDCVISFRITLGFSNRIRSGRHWGPIEIVPQRNTCQVEQCGGNINMSGDRVDDFSLGHTRTANVEGDINVFLKGARFAWLQAVVRHMVAIVGGEYDISVVEEVEVGETLDHAGDHFINCCERLQA